MKTVTRLGIKGLLATAMILVSASVVAKSGSSRPLDEILNYKLFGISLSMAPQAAISMMTGQGFEMQGESYPDQRNWKFRKGAITVTFDLREGDETLRNIGATENARGGQIELQPQLEAIIASWGESADGKPVCQSRELRGKIAMAECGVSDPEDRKASYYALMSFVQVQQRLGRH